MKTKLGGVMIGLLAVLALGCGGDDTTAAVDGGATIDAAVAAVDASSNLRYSCDHVTGGTRSGCADTVYTAATTAAVNVAKSQCVPQGGTVGDTCDTTGSVGGCRNFNAGGAPGVTTTAWFYTGTVADTMARCTRMGATFVTP